MRLARLEALNAELVSERDALRSRLDTLGERLRTCERAKAALAEAARKFAATAKSEVARLDAEVAVCQAARAAADQVRESLERAERALADRDAECAWLREVVAQLAAERDDLLRAVAEVTGDLRHLREAQEAPERHGLRLERRQAARSGGQGDEHEPIRAVG
jgi:chromosome segregation ATPase